MEVTTLRKEILILTDFREVKDPNGTWYLCNDEQVIVIPEPDCSQSESAYLLFYEMAD